MDNDKIVNFFFEIATLRRLKRNHRQMIEGSSDSIADHSFRVTLIGLILGRMEKVDEAKVMKICLFHDLVEARTGDANWINRQYVKQDEDLARADQASGLPIEDEMLELLKEYEERESKESIVAKDADLLDQMILQQEYFKNGDSNREKWQTHTQKGIVTDSAKQLAEKINTADPFNWLYELGRIIEKEKR